MDKILVIGVGNAGREITKEIKKMGIPNATYETFGNYGGEEDGADIPHHNLITMNGKESISAGAGPEEMKALAEHVKEDIREIISRHFEESEKEK